MTGQYDTRLHGTTRHRTTQRTTQHADAAADDDADADAGVDDDADDLHVFCFFVMSTSIAPPLSVVDSAKARGAIAHRTSSTSKGSRRLAMPFALPRAMSPIEPLHHRHHHVHHDHHREVHEHTTRPYIWLVLGL